MSKPGSTSLVSLAGFLSPAGTSPNTDTLKSIEKKTTEKEEEEEKETVMHRVRVIIEKYRILSYFNIISIKYRDT